MVSVYPRKPSHHADLSLALNKKGAIVTPDICAKTDVVLVDTTRASRVDDLHQIATAISALGVRGRRINVLTDDAVALDWDSIAFDDIEMTQSLRTVFVWNESLVQHSI